MSSGREKTDPLRAGEQRRQESEEQLSLLQTITSELTAADDLSSALEVVLRDVCEKTGWVLGHAWVPNPDGTALDFVSAWYCGDGELKPFRTVSEDLNLNPALVCPDACGNRNGRPGLRTLPTILIFRGPEPPGLQV